MILLIEFVLFLSLLAGVMLGFSEVYKHNSFELSRIDAKKRVIAFENAFRSSFTGIMDSVRENCPDGYDTASCNGVTPLPSISNSGNDVSLTYVIPSSFPNRDSLVTQISGFYENAFCSVNDDGSNLSIICRETKLNSSSGVPTETLDISLVPVYSFSFGFLGKAGSYIWLNKTIDLADIYSSRKLKNENLFYDIANLLKDYHLRRRIEENTNICKVGGGLHSEDDVYIPWVMQGYTAGINDLCNTSTSTSCSCSNIKWDTIDQTNRVNQTQLLTNLGAGYNLVDYFGNKIEVFALVDGTDTPYTPPNPSANYTNKPPYTGLIRLNSSFSCVTNKDKACYYKFVYPN